MDSHTQPQGQMFFNYIENIHGPQAKRHLKRWVNTNYQLAESIPQRWFLLRCRSNNIIPQHMLNLSKRFRTFSFHSDFCKQRLFDIHKHISFKLLNLEIRDINFHMNFLNKSLKNLISELNIDNLTINNFFTYTNKKCKLIREKHNRNLIKKFECLLKKQKLLVSTSKEQFFKNLTDVHIPDDIIDVLSLGPKFSINKGCDKKDILLNLLKKTTYSYTRNPTRILSVISTHYILLLVDTDLNLAPL